MTSRSTKLTPIVAKIYRKIHSHFTKDEAEKLLVYFQYEVGSAKINRIKFKDILHHWFQLTDDIIVDRVFRAFDQDNDSFISMEEWLKGLAIFLRGKPEEKVNFCFAVYDLNGDGIIAREEMHTLLKTSMVKNSTDEDPDEAIKELIDFTVKLLDMDQDGRVTQSDFYNTGLDDSMKLEVLGQCLPTDKDRNNFIDSIMRGDFTAPRNSAQPTQSG